MILRIPDLYMDFHCIANQCLHSCCMNWEIGIDEESYEYYCSISGEFGDKLRNAMKDETNPHFKLHHGKCPFLDQNQLCEIYQNLGEEALCEVCTEYPRFEVDYKNVRERVLALSCEAAGRLLLSRKEPIVFINRYIDGDLDESRTMQESYYLQHYKELGMVRDLCIAMAQNRQYDMEQRIAALLEFAELIQVRITKQQVHTLTKEKLYQIADQCLTHIRDLKSAEQLHSAFCQRMDILMKMEVMEDEWIQEMNNVVRIFYSEHCVDLYADMTKKLKSYLQQRTYESEHLLVYFIYRYIIKDVYDGRLMARLKFCLLCYRAIEDMDRTCFFMSGENFTLEDRVQNVRIFCKEAEHSEICLQYLLSNADTLDKDSL